MIIPNCVVRVDCLTYNHSEYIVDALNGFCLQETRFPYICTIIDDASTDGTPDIINRYLQDHFNIQEPVDVEYEETDDYSQVLVQHKKNRNCYFRVKYLKYNHFRAKKTKQHYFDEIVDAKYIALCEGDDYWIDPLKLQKQVDYLENNLDYGMVTTASKIYVQGIGMKEGSFGHAYRGMEDLLVGNYVFNASVLKKKSLEDRYIHEIGYHTDWKMGDWPRILHCAIVSKIGFIEEPMSVYRVLPNSASHSDDFNKFKAFNESSVAVSKWFINKYQLDAEKLDPLLDNWLHRRLLLKACSVGNIEYVNQNKRKVSGLSVKERITVFLSSKYFTFALYGYYLRVRKTVNRLFN